MAKTQKGSRRQRRNKRTVKRGGGGVFGFPGFVNKTINVTHNAATAADKFFTDTLSKKTPIAPSHKNFNDLLEKMQEYSKNKAVWNALVDDTQAVGIIKKIVLLQNFLAFITDFYGNLFFKQKFGKNDSIKTLQQFLFATGFILKVSIKYQFGKLAVNLSPVIEEYKTQDLSAILSEKLEYEYETNLLSCIKTLKESESINLSVFETLRCPSCKEFIGKFNEQLKTIGEIEYIKEPQTPNTLDSVLKEIKINDEKLNKKRNTIVQNAQDENDNFSGENPQKQQAPPKPNKLQSKRKTTQEFNGLVDNSQVNNQPTRRSNNIELGMQSNQLEQTV